MTLGKMWVCARRWAGHRCGPGEEVREDAGMQVGRMLGNMWVWVLRWKKNGHTVPFMHHISNIHIY